MEDAGLNLVRGGEGWVVEEREGRGRCLVATRQLEVKQLQLSLSSNLVNRLWGRI